MVNFTFHRFSALYLVATSLCVKGSSTRIGQKERNDIDSTFAQGTPFEVWASDQSNSVAGKSGLGLEGSFLWIWEANGIGNLIKNGVQPAPLPCKPNTSKGPCNLMDVFMPNLVEYDASGQATGNTVGSLSGSGFGRLHGMLKDPSNRYVTANIFAPGGGYVGVIDTLTKEAIALFRITSYYLGGNTSTGNRSNHMSFFSKDGSHIIISNLNGKALERIDVTRDDQGLITQLTFNKSASLGLGKGMSVASSATVFKGQSAFGKTLLGNISGDYSAADLGDLTLNNKCKENGCGQGGGDGAAGGRPNNVIICPIPSDEGLAYMTLGGGGLLVAEIGSTPMKIVGEYGKEVVYGAGCGGVQSSVNGRMFLNAGVFASGVGAEQSMFALFAFDDFNFPLHGYEFNPENQPAPDRVFEDDGNTATGGNLVGDAQNTSGQNPNQTTRRDSHGMVATKDGQFVHVADRIQNVIEVFDTTTYDRTTYDLVSSTGQSGRDGFPKGACFSRSVTDDAALPLNDPAPDLMDITPDGRFLTVAFRGPVPVSVTHSAQGSCPGVGIVQLAGRGNYGRLVEVLRTTNTVDTASAGGISGGTNYAGSERSDVHHVTVIAR